MATKATYKDFDNLMKDKNVTEFIELCQAWSSADFSEISKEEFNDTFGDLTKEEINDFKKQVTELSQALKKLDEEYNQKLLY